MAADVKIDIAAEFTGKKAFKQADTATQKLTNGVKKLAGAVGLAYGTTAIIAYGKASVRAFAADDKAARTLSKTLSNLGLAFADPEIKTFISTLERQSGVLDDVLRPAYQKLVTTTGDYRRSQALLETALDLSAQSGVDLLTVSNDIGKAFVGNTRGLVKYNLGLNKTQLAAMSFEEVLARITKISAGQAALAADTYAGKLDKLTVASENAKEVLGGALLDSIIKLGGGDVDKTTDKIDKLSTSLASLIRLATGTSKMSLKEILQSVDYKFGIIPTNKVKAPRSASPAGTFMRNQAEIKAAATAKKLADDQAKSQKALTKAQQNALKITKAKAIFDLQKIQIEAALKGKISAEDAIRLKLMKAIEEENLTNIEKYQKALEDAQKKTTELNVLLTAVKEIEIKDPFGMWKIDPITASINALTTSINGVGTSITARGTEWSSFANLVSTTVLRPNLSEFNSSFSAASAAAAAALAAQNATNNLGVSGTNPIQAKADAAAAAAKAAADVSAAKIAALEAEAKAIAALAGSNLSAQRNAAIAAGLAQQALEDALKALEQANTKALAAAAAAATTATTATKIDVTITGDPFSDPNVIAEKIVNILNEAGSRGTIDVIGFE